MYIRFAQNTALKQVERPPSRPTPNRARPQLKDYFATAMGSGYLATASLDGTVNLALYDRPLVLDDELVVFAMKQRLTRENLRENPNAVYAFHEPGQRRGIRLYLEKVREESNPAMLEKFRRRSDWLSDAKEADDLNTLVFFRVTNSLPLVIR